MIVAVGSTKGGVGKTTLAVNLVCGLALRGLAVLLIDGDEQQHALAFTELRASLHLTTPNYVAVALHGSAIRTQARQLRANYDHIVIDVGGRDTGSLRAALTVADLVLIPTAPRSFDLWGLGDTVELVREAREVNDQLRAVGVVNLADPAGQDNAEAQETLTETGGIEASPYQLRRRKAYPNAAARGLSVLEYLDPGNREGAMKARAEFAELLNSLFPAERKSNARTQTKVAAKYRQQSQQVYPRRIWTGRRNPGEWAPGTKAGSYQLPASAAGTHRRGRRQHGPQPNGVCHPGRE